MKQSNNAIKFLLAQYRAIFNRAFVAGLASTLALTAGLAASSAQAATSLNDALTEDVEKAPGISYTVSKEESVSPNGNKKYIGDLNISNTGILKMDSTSGDVAHVLFKKLNLNGGTINLTANSNKNGGLQGIYDPNQLESGNWDNADSTFTATNGEVKISGPTSIQATNIDLDGTTLNLTGNGSGDGPGINAEAGDNAKTELLTNRGNLNISNSTINMESGSYIGGSFVNVRNSNIKLNGNDKTDAKTIARLTSWTNAKGNYLSLVDSTVTVDKNKYGRLASSDLRISGTKTVITNHGQLGLGTEGGKISIQDGLITNRHAQGETPITENHHIFLMADTTMTGGKLDLYGPHGIVGSTQFNSGDAVGGEQSNFTTNLTATGGEIVVDKSQIQVKDLTLAGNVNVTVGGMIGQGTSWGDNAMIGGSATNSKVFIQESAHVTLGENSQIIGNQINIQGGVIEFNGSGTATADTKEKTDGLSNNSSFIRAFVNNGSINLDGGTLQINDGKVAGLYGANVNLNSGVIDFGNSESTLVIDRNLKGDSGSSSVKVGNVKFQNTGKLTFGKDATVDFNGATSFAGVIKSDKQDGVTVSGNLDFKGDSNSSTKVDFITTGKVSLTGTMTIADAGNTIGLSVTKNEDSFDFALATNNTDGNFGGFKENSSGTLHLDLGGMGIGSISSDKAAAFKQDLRNVLGFGSGGLIYANGIKFDLAPDAIDENNSSSWDKVQDAVNGGVQDGQLTNTEIVVKANEKVFGGLGSIKLDTGSSVNVAGGNTPLELNGYKNKDGQLQNGGSLVVVGTGESATVGGAALNTGSKLSLAAEKGIIGNITAQDGTGKVTISANSDIKVVSNNTKVSDAATTDQLGNIGSSSSKILEVDIQGTATVKGLFAKNATVANTLNANEVNVDNATITGTVNADKITLNTGDIKGGSIVGEKTELKGNKLTLSENANVQVAKIELDNDGVLQVGTESSETSSASSASLTVENLSLNGGTLIIDPDFNQKTATAFVRNIGTRESFKLDGTVIVGQNSALGLGGESEDFYKALAKQQNGESLNEDGIGAIVYVGKAGLDITNSKLIVGSEDINTLKTKLNNTTTYQVYLGTGSGVQLSTKSLSDAEKSKASVFKGVSGVLAANQGATILVPANLQSEQLKYIFGNDLTKLDFEGTSGTLTVTTDNGLYSGVVDSLDDLNGTGDFTFRLSSNARHILRELSAPSFDYVTKALNTTKIYNDYAEFEQAVTDSAQNGTSAYDQYGFAVLNDGAGYNFLGDAAGSTNPRSIEQAARLSTFGGSVQSTIIAASSTYDAIAGRIGMGNSQAKLTVADNQGTGLWVAPVYRSASSDGFSADGLSAGADVDIYGAALGADYTMSNGLRLGAMFNVGSGSSDGNDAGAGISNDFNYYGFGLYAAFAPMENLNLGADLSYTVLDNDFDAETNVASWGKMEGQADASALSFGLNAQYTFQSAIDVAPHIGLRFTKLDVDSYSVKAAGAVIAETNSSNMNIFSIPVGVSLSKDISTESGWKVRPAVDLTLTFNAGDQDFDEHTKFTGVLGPDIAYSTEVLDSFTYGAAAAISVSNGGFSFGFNLGYTGSSNTDEFGLGANARFAF